MSAVVSLANPYITDIGPTINRTAQHAVNMLPPGTRVVSSDTHWEVCEDIFYEAFPQHLKELAPRVWFDKYWRMGFPGKSEALSTDEGTETAAIRSLASGVADMAVRLNHFETEGVVKEIAYPQSLLFFVGHKDREIQELIWRTYNEYIASVSRDFKGRFYGVGVVSNWWDPTKAESALRQIVDLGLKTFMIPLNPGKFADGQDISYGDEPMDRFWNVVAEVGLPVSFHITENHVPGRRGALGTAITNTFNQFRKPLSQMIFSGLFDRHPSLKVVFAEGGLSWVPTTLQDAEMVYDCYGSGDLLDPIKERPTYYWQNNCYATFQNDLFGLRNLEHIGADNVMWANDYPHSEGSFGFGASSMQSVLDLTTPEEARKILGGTATELYKLDEI